MLLTYIYIDIYIYIYKHEYINPTIEIKTVSNYAIEGKCLTNNLDVIIHDIMCFVETKC